MKVGFTGTREGMTHAQRQGVWNLFHMLKITELHHGDCIGADADAHDLAQNMPHVRIVIHPPIDERHRSFCQGAHEMRAPKTHFARNRDIVDETQILIATPLQSTPQPRGGTWYTINYGSKHSGQVYVVWPGGTAEQGIWLPMR